MAYNVSVIVAQSAATQRVFDCNLQQGRVALHSIEDSGREALVEMRRLLGLLRTDDDQLDVQDPQQGLDDIEALVSQVREAGLPIEFRVEGTPRPCPPPQPLGVPHRPGGPHQRDEARRASATVCRST